MGSVAGASPATTTSVSSCAFAAYASHHARWNAQPENGVAQGFRAARASHVARGMSATVVRSMRSGAVAGPVIEARCFVRRTGRLRVKGGGSHCRMLHLARVWLRWQRWLLVFQSWDAAPEDVAA